MFLSFANFAFLFMHILCVLNVCFSTSSSVSCSSSLFSRPPNKNLEGVVVLVTAPTGYSQRLSLQLKTLGATVIACPTVETDFLSGDELACLIEALSTDDNKKDRLVNACDYIAFTSRRGIEAAFRVGGKKLIKLLDDHSQNPTAIALGADAEALVFAGICRSSILVPDDASPQGIVSLLSNLTSVDDTTKITRVMCPVPKVSGGLSEPEVVPNFLSSLRALKGFEVHRVNAYETRWSGPSAIAEKAMKALQEGKVNVITISSTAEVEGLFLLCKHYGVDLISCCNGNTRTTKITTKVAAHGPVTARGARMLGLHVDATSENYSSFKGLCDAVAQCVNRAT